MLDHRQVWPAHPQPQDDELFSSWVQRLARANAIKLSMLIYKVDSIRRHSSLNKNVDLTIPDQLLEALALKSYSNYVRLFETTLRSYEGSLFERYSENGHHAICLLDTGETTHHRPFQQFCPVCLSEPIPYYRKHWRISFVTVCTHHHCLLHDRCPNCQSPVLPLRNDTRHRHKLYTGLFCACHECQFDLSDSPVLEADPTVLVDTLWYLHVLKQGYACIEADYWVYSFSLFAVLRQLMRMQAARIDNLPDEVTNLDVDHLPHSMRYQILLALSGIFTHWPERFEEFIRTEKGRYHKLKEMNKAASCIPFWVDGPAKALTHRPNIPVPEESVLSAIEIMEKRGIAVNPYSVNRFMGYQDSMVIKRILKQRGNE